MDDDNHTASLVEGLKYELRSALETGNKDHEKAVRAELDRLSPAPSKGKHETADAPADKETR